MASAAVTARTTKPKTTPTVQTPTVVPSPRPKLQIDTESVLWELAWAIYDCRVEDEALLRSAIVEHMEALMSQGDE